MEIKKKIKKKLSLKERLQLKLKNDKNSSLPNNSMYFNFDNSWISKFKKSIILFIYFFNKSTNIKQLKLLIMIFN